jgi:hypothetical protein
LFLQTLWGLLASMLLDFYSARDIVTSLCFTLPFPLYLIGLKWFRAAIWALWAVSFAQWIDRCFLDSPPALSNPLSDIHAATLFAATAFVHAGYWMLASLGRASGPVTLRNAFT